MYAHMQGQHFEKSPVISPARRRSETQQNRVDWAVVTPMLIGGPLAFASIFPSVGVGSRWVSI